MSTDWAVPGVNLDYQLGPLFLAHCFNWSLYGLLILQVLFYHGNFDNDPRNHKTLVYSVFFLDSISIACSTHSGYWVFVKNWGNVDVLHGLGWSWATVPASTGLIALIVHSFYAYRVWRVSQMKNFYSPLLIVMLSGSSCGFSFAAAKLVSELQTFTYIRLFIPTLWLSFGIAADFVCCTTLIYYFTATKVRFTLTRRLMMRLVRIVVETAIVTIVAAGIKMFLIFSRHDNMHLLLCLLLPRLYSNALMASLNSRSSAFGGTQVRNGEWRKNRILHLGASLNAFLDRKKTGDTSAFELETGIEAGAVSESPSQVLRYHRLSDNSNLSPPPAIYNQ